MSLVGEQVARGSYRVELWQRRLIPLFVPITIEGRFFEGYGQHLLLLAGRVGELVGA